MLKLVTHSITLSLLTLLSCSSIAPKRTPSNDGSSDKGYYLVDNIVGCYKSEIEMTPKKFMKKQKIAKEVHALIARAHLTRFRH